MTLTLKVPAEIQAEIDGGALFVISHSGGKDSQAQTALIRELVPADRIVVVHAVLPEVDWKGTEDHARTTSAGLEFISCRAGKTFFELVESRGKFPSPAFRQCTSDLKRGPINKVIRRLCKERGISRVVSCLGLRAGESASRAKVKTIQINKRLSVGGRTVIDWLPIHHLTTLEVFAVVADAGQDLHWAYGEGSTRLSCCFCILASKADLTTAARLNPDLYKRYVETEKRLDFTLSPSRKSLEEITGITVEEDFLAIPAFLRRAA